MDARRDGWQAAGVPCVPMATVPLAVALADPASFATSANLQLQILRGRAPESRSTPPLDGCTYLSYAGRIFCSYTYPLRRGDLWAAWHAVRRRDLGRLRLHRRIRSPFFLSFFLSFFRIFFSRVWPWTVGIGLIMPTSPSLPGCCHSFFYTWRLQQALCDHDDIVQLYVILLSGPRRYTLIGSHRLSGLEAKSPTVM